MATPNWTFITIKLSQDDKPELEAFIKGYNKHFLDVITDVLAMGYKVSLNWIDKQNAFVVSVSGTNESAQNKGATVTSWSDELSEAIFMMGYKALVLGKSKTWVEIQTDSSNWG